MKQFVFCLFLVPGLCFGTLIVRGDVSRTSRGMTVTGRDVEISGTAEGHILLKNAKQVYIHDFRSDYSLEIENCESVVVSRARIRALHPLLQFRETYWALKIDECRGVMVKDSEFDGGGQDADAVIVNGNGHNAEWRYFGHQESKGYDPTNVRYGKPKGANPDWEWTSISSYRSPGQSLWHGRKTDTRSSNISFLRCDFRNAKRAGLFVVWTNGYSVRDCRGSGTNDYVMGAEWSTGGLWSGNICAGDMAFWYFTQNTTVTYCQADSLWLGSNGEPCINVLFDHCQLKDSLYLSQGVFWEWWLGAWLENVEARDCSARQVYVTANNKAGVPPELLAKASLTRVTAKTLYTSSAIVNLDDCLFADINRWIPKSGVPSVLVGN